MKFTIIECADKVTKTGKPMKQMTLLEEGKENVEPRVAMWDNHPEFESAVKGGTINGTLEKKDSGTPIPEHPGKNYVNRTLLPEMNPNGILAPTPSNDLKEKVDILWKEREAKIGKDFKEDVVEYPDGSEIPEGDSPF